MDSKEKSTINQMTEEELVQAGSRRVQNGAQRAVTGVVVFLILVVLFNVGQKILNPYPGVTSINELYGMEYAGDYIEDNVGKKVHYSDIVVWQVDPSTGLAQDLLSDIYFKSSDDVDRISPLTSITIKGEIEGVNSNGRLVIRNAILEDVLLPETNNTESDNTQFGTTTSLPDDYYDVSLTAEEFIEEAKSNPARLIRTYAGQRVLITGLEITYVGTDDVYFDLFEQIYLRHPEDIYLFSEGERVDVIGSIEEVLGKYCINDATLADLPANPEPVQSSIPDRSGSSGDGKETAEEVFPEVMFDASQNLSQKLDGKTIHLSDISGSQCTGSTVIVPVSLNRGDFQIRIEFSDENEALIASDFDGYSVYGVWDSDSATVLNATLDWDSVGPSDPTD